MAKKPSTTTTLEDFLEQHDAEPENYDEVDTLNFERDELYEVTILSHHQFDGKFGPSVVITYTNDEGTYKGYLGGFEVSHFNKFIEGQDLPLSVKMARTQRESQQNEGRMFNRLIIAKA